MDRDKTIKRHEVTLGDLDAERAPLMPGYKHDIVICKPTIDVDILEAEDSLFRSQSAVFLPDGIPDDGRNGSGTEGQKKYGGLDVLKVFFLFCNKCQEEGTRKKILITGHTDTVGSSADNQELSQKRAQMILSLIQGGAAARGEFVRIAHSTHVEEDQQQILQWIAKRVHVAFDREMSQEISDFPSWTEVDPVNIDGDIGPKTQEAIRKFRLLFQKSFPLPGKYESIEFSPDLHVVRDAIRPGAVFDETAWAAVYEIFQAEIQLTIRSSGLSLETLRSNLQWVDDQRKVVGCGETWPVDKRGTDNYRSQCNRRVEILFYDHHELLGPLPCKDGTCAESDCHIFRTIDRYKGGTLQPTLNWQHIDIEASELGYAKELNVMLMGVEGLYSPGFEMLGETDPKSAGYDEGYISKDNLGRIFVNHVPRTDPNQSWDDVRKKDVQYVELCAEVTPVGGRILPRARVEWEWFDPDDPSNTEYGMHKHAAQLIDTNDEHGKSRGQDNKGHCDYPRPNDKAVARFGPADGYGFSEGENEHLGDSAIIDGKSRVRLHVSNVGGDNFVVVARIKDDTDIEKSNTHCTGVMTVWKRIDVEYVYMKGALELPVGEVPQYFNPAFVQMDFWRADDVDPVPFLTTHRGDVLGASADFAEENFQHSRKPGWFFLAAVQRAASANALARKTSSDRFKNALWEGTARIKEYNEKHGKVEFVVVPSRIEKEVQYLGVKETKDGPYGFMPVADQEVVGKDTYFALQGINYVSNFEVPKGEKDVGRSGWWDEGGAYGQMDYYYLRHFIRQPGGERHEGGLGFMKDELYVHVMPKGSTEFGGISPPRDPRHKKYGYHFSGRVLVFTRRADAQVLEERQLGSLVHEFVHAFGYPHQCGYYSFEGTTDKACPLNYYFNWLYKPGTQTVQRFVFGDLGRHLCARHLQGVREVNLEDHPDMWEW